MWPWEHAIVGYIGYALFCHCYHHDSPSGLETLVVIFASVLPDLVDKPLAWQYGVFDSGYAIGHSVFFAIPFAVFGGLLARAVGRPRVGVGFAIGYLFHLPADVLPYSALGGPVQVERLLWPVAPTESVGEQEGLFEEFWRYFAGYRADLLSGAPSFEVLLGLGLGVVALVLWLYDGTPVLREIVVGTKRLVVAVATSVNRVANWTLRSRR